jgi:hypothetical protein
MPELSRPNEGSNPSRVRRRQGSIERGNWMKIEVHNNGATRNITSVSLWVTNGVPLIQIGVKETYFYAQAPLDTSLHHGSFCIQFFRSANELKPNNTRVLFFPETKEEALMCNEGEIFEQVQRSTFSFVIIKVNPINTNTHRLLWSDNVS